MKKYLPIFLKSPLFANIEQSNMEAVLSCLSAKVSSYEKNTFIHKADEKIRFIGLILSGSVNIIWEDYWGNRDIITKLYPGDLFAEAFAYAQIERPPVSVAAAERTEVLLMDSRRILKTCSSACSFHAQLIQNMLQIIADKNMVLMQKMEHISKRSTREKLRSYLSAQAQRAGSSRFDIPFNRQELADYLSVDRSAMSAALCKMRDEGTLSFNRNHFELKGRPENSVF